MADSKREAVLKALLNLLKSALPNAVVKRNASKPNHIDPGGTVIMKDGDPGDPDEDFNPHPFTYSHQVELDVGIFESSSLTREEALDQLLVPIGAAIKADRILGGLALHVEAGAPPTGDIEAFGADPGRWGTVTITIHYETTDPLG